MERIRFFSKLMFVALALTFAVGFVASDAQAQETMTIAQVRNLQDDSPVLMKGYIVERLDVLDYVFKDDTGRINLKFGEGIWFEQEPNPTQRVIVQGHLERADGRHEQVFVESIQVD